MLSAMGSSIVQRLDLFMVSAQIGMASAGIYTIAFYVVAVIEMPSRSLVARRLLHRWRYIVVI